MKNVVNFQTGDDELDKHLKEEGIASDELVEVSGVSSSGKTYFCLKMASLALLEKEIACLYIDTTNYVN
jgi:RecA/RadA recombinase